MVDVACPRVFLEKQKEFLESDARFIYYCGGFGSGKTLCLAHKIIRGSLENPGAVSLMASATYPMLRDTVLRTFLEETTLLQKAFDEAGAGVKLIREFNRGELRIVFFNGSVVLFRSCDSPEKFKSLNLDFVGLDEPTDVSEDVFRMLQGRLRGRHARNQRHFLAMSGNPGSRLHWLYGLFFEHPPSGDYKVISTTSYDNCFLPASYISSLEAGYSEEYKRRYLRGQWVSFEGLVYPEFSREVHVGDFRDRMFSSYGGGLDVGFTNPSAFVLVGRDGDDNLFVLQELYQSRLTPVELAAAVREMVAPVMGSFSEVLCDPSAPGVIESVGRFVRCSGADNDVFSGIGRVRSRFHLRRLFIDRGCVNLVRELEGYVYQKEKQGAEYSEVPVKKNDHLCDALRYCCMEPGGTAAFLIG